MNQVHRFREIPEDGPLTDEHVQLMVARAGHDTLRMTKAQRFEFGAGVRIEMLKLFRQIGQVLGEPVTAEDERQLKAYLDASWEKARRGG